MKQRTRRQWKKLIKQVHNFDTYYKFVKRYWRGHTKWHDEPTFFRESCDIYRGWNLLASVDFIEYQHPEVGACMMSTAYSFASRFTTIDVLGNGEREWDALADLLIQASFLAVSYVMHKDMLELHFSDGSELLVHNPHQHYATAHVTVYEDDEYVISY